MEVSSGQVGQIGWKKKKGQSTWSLYCCLNRIFPHLCLYFLIFFLLLGIFYLWSSPLCLFDLLSLSFLSFLFLFKTSICLFNFPSFCLSFLYRFCNDFLTSAVCMNSLWYHWSLLSVSFLIIFWHFSNFSIFGFGYWEGYLDLVPGGLCFFIFILFPVCALHICGLAMSFNFVLLTS